MRPSLFYISLVLIACCASQIFAQAPVETTTEEGTPENQAPAMSADEVRRLIAKLDSERFLIREDATEKLSHAGPEAIDELTAAVSSGSLEKSIRCIHILKRFTLGDDINAEIAATERLELIAAAGNDGVSQYAQDTLNRVATLQEERSRRVLRSLGLKFSEYMPAPGFVDPSRGPSVTIDDSYKGGPKELYYLRQLRFIEDVQMSGEKITAEYLKQVATMQNVRLLTIKETPNIDDEALGELNPLLPRLENVRFYYLPIDDEVIPMFGKMGRLIKAELYGTELSEKGKAELFAQFGGDPRRMDIRNGAFLGVQGQTIAESPCTVEDVPREGSAFAAGVRKADVIEQVDGKDVPHFTALTEFLRDKKVGDKIKMKILRDGEPIELTVTLGKWPMRQDYVGR
ncbi:PDZ domain-containing protein [Blastopirellula sp. JC732]|uniref:PDZ domain-containing protein n=1 Tax=Blastopirellula sediminis TaxID=2894196 RepID=A0A9X1MQU6_9BACT|nr:PDZ domain-containing protein [Blastopirellula sediminis]MCC9606006.1 PDZ domain-containing protein [Blastopirellula sediminis]MCC9630695.1 PDZ domain-containing protein [Blastopirellula sediminis]